MDTYVEEVDNITKNIVQEIVRECSSYGLEIDFNFCAYYVKLLTIDPFWKISPEKTINRENIQRLVTFCINKLQQPESPSLINLKIQQYFLSHINGKKNFIESHRKQLNASVAPLKEDILNFTLTEGNKAQESKLFRRIALYVTLLSGLGNPKQNMVLRDAMAALRSIFDENEIFEFGKLKKQEKLEELENYQNLVTGIRLFNRDCGRPTAGIEDLPKLLLQALNIIHMHLSNQLLTIMEYVNIATTLIEDIFLLKKDTCIIAADNVQVIGQELPENVTTELFENTIDLLTLWRQYEVYLRKMINNVKEIEDSAKELFNNLRDSFATLHQVIKYKVAVPTYIVFPLFIELAQTWKKLQEEAIRLSLHNEVYKKLFVLAQCNKDTINRLETIFGDKEILTDGQRFERTMGQKIKITNKECVVLDPANIKDFDLLQLEYLGFCAWSLVEMNGGLIPGNPNMGVCEWNDSYFVFSTPEAAAKFGLDPNSYVMKTLDIARKKPELINLLRLHHRLYSLRDVGVLYEKPPEVILKLNKPVQTDLHPERPIDPEYKWNVWDLYRQAIQLANITNCKTHSMQTKKSHFRYGVFAQTTEPRDKMCQTKKDNYTNVARPMNYLFGLRGRYDDNQHIIDLTRPVDEEKFYQCASAMENPPKIKTRPYVCRKYKSPATSIDGEQVASEKSIKCKFCHKPISESLIPVLEFGKKIDFNRLIIQSSESAFEETTQICMCEVAIHTKKKLN